MDFDGYVFNFVGINKLRYIDNEVVKYYIRFKQFENANGRHASHRNMIYILSDDFKESDKAAAYCYIYNNSDRMVVINRKYWQEAVDLEREVLVFHETAHCIYDQDHRENSIMQEEILDPIDYITDYDFYVKELFSPNLNRSSIKEKTFQFQEY
jgi:hypothetical protein